MSDDTDILEKKHPVIKVIIDYFFKRLELLVVAILLTGGISFFTDKNARKAIWEEAGPHLKDAHDEIYSNKDTIISMQVTVSNLEQQIKQLENKQQ